MFKPEETKIESIKWDGEDRVTMNFENGFSWSGAKRKDFWNPDDNWESEIVPGTIIRLWTVQFSLILGFEILKEGKWVSVWCHANDFQLKAERESSAKAYSDFIQSEGEKIAVMIDEGKTLEEIDKLISKDHSGNTHAWALNIGVKNAKNRENAEAIRKAHNKAWGVGEESSGHVDRKIGESHVEL